MICHSGDRHVSKSGKLFYFGKGIPFRQFVLHKFYKYINAHPDHSLLASLSTSLSSSSSPVPSSSSSSSSSSPSSTWTSMSSSSLPLSLSSRSLSLNAART